MLRDVEIRETSRRHRDNALVIGDDTYAYARDLPHLANQGKTYFVTFVTQLRWVLPETARALTLDRCLREHARRYWLHTAVVMPDHAHLVLTPYADAGLASIVGRIKGGSAYDINRSLSRAGGVWRRESFDHIIRSDESLHAKCEYVLNNPVRAGLVQRWRDYPWHWQTIAS